VGTTMTPGERLVV